MNTTKLKPFAQQARKILMEGVRLRMLFWGFDGKNNDTREPEAIPGGVIFRNEVYSDSGLVGKWQQMKVRINSHTYEDAIEEAAYTWFNRLMAIKILEKNGYEDTQLGYDGAVPALLAKARNGIMPYLGENEKQKVRDHLLNGDEESAFGLLLIGYCRRHPLLNRVFGGIDDFTELLLPNNLLTKGGIIELLNVNGFVQEDDYKQVELIGWLYQFYISEKKDEVFKGFKENKKARKEDIPAATQIFTPKWIVKYLVENTVGKTWLDLNPDSTVKAQLKYLVENDSGKTAPLEGVDEAGKITLLDPAAGSGHILVTAFDLFMLMYKEEGSTTRQAVREILKKNLFGLDIDKRAAQLARFAVLMKAASYDQAVLNENILPHIYAMPEPVHFSNDHLEKFLYEGYNGLALDRDGIRKDLNKGLLLMRQAQNLGSIIQFDLQDDTRKQLKLRYKFWCEKDEKGQLTIDELSWWKPLAEYLNPLCILLDKYACVAANPPYMGQKNMNGELKDYVGKFYPNSKADLFAVFMETCFNRADVNARVGMINQHSWMFLGSFEKLRISVIKEHKIESMLHLGPRTFEELTGEVVQSTAFVIKNSASNSKEEKATFYRLVDYRNNTQKQKAFEEGLNRFPNVLLSNFHKVPGYSLAYWLSAEAFLIMEKSKKLGDFSFPKSGMSTTDNVRFVRQWYEVNFKNVCFDCSSVAEAKSTSLKWFPYSKGEGFQKWFGQNLTVVNWQDDGSEIKQWVVSNPRDPDTTHWSRRIFNTDVFFQDGVVWSDISTGNISARYLPKGFIPDSVSIGLYGLNDKLYYFLGLINSKVAMMFLDFLCPTIHFNPGNTAKLPIIYDEFEANRVSQLCKENVNEVRKLLSSYETSWEFQSFKLNFQSRSIREAFLSWQDVVSKAFFKIHKTEEELNRIFIQIYSFHNEIDPIIPLDQISILSAELDYENLSALTPPFDLKTLPIRKEVVGQQFISYAIGLLMGRYRLDKSGLNIASPDASDEELASYNYHGHEFNIDDDAIIPLVSEDSPFVDNVVRRFKDVLIAIWGEEILTDNINFLNECLGISYEKFLIEKFWDYHKKVYQKKPIYWLFNSAGGNFKVLVYMHRMDKFTVQKIRLNYLHKYIEYLTNQLEKLKANGATNRTADKLEKALQDCREYDKILKPLADQQISFDLDDGVTVNYAKFKPAVAPIK